MIKLLLAIGIVSALVFFGGCGGGTDSINSILDVKNPDVVKAVSAYSSHKRIRLTWQKNDAQTIVGYNVFRSTGGTAGFLQIGSVGQMSSPFYQDEGDDIDKDGIPDGLTNNISYFYKVTAFDRTGRETPLELSAAVSAIPGQLPNETIDLSVENVRSYASKSQSFIAWNRVEHDRIFGYYVYRSISGSSQGFQLITITPAEVSSFIDGGLDPAENYVYQVAPAVNELDTYSGQPLVSGLLEGRKTESRAVRPLPGDSTIPKPPGSASGAPFSIRAISSNVNGKDGVLLQFSRPVANTDGSLLVDNDDLISGAYLIYRSSKLYGPYQLIGILENIGSTAISEFFDPEYRGNDHKNDYYYVTVGDQFGSLSDRSDIASVNAATPPPTVKTLSATSGQGFGNIEVVWKAILDNEVDGYNVYRSSTRDSGFVPVGYNITDQDPRVDWVKFTDSSPNLTIGATYYYKLSATSKGLESSLSAATAAAPGPANGIIVLEGENAVKIDSYLTGPNRNPPANHPAQYWPPHWKYQRMGYHYPFSGAGVLYVEPQNNATSDIQLGERLDLKWEVDVQSLLGGATAGAITVDVYMVTADDSTTGQYKIFLDDKEIASNIQPGIEIPTTVSTGFDGIQAEINFRDSSYSTPLQPTRRLLGSLRIDHLRDYDVVTSPFADTEIIYMTIVHTGPGNGTAVGEYGNFKLDSLVMVVR
jgi:fibronectin type 3 domain-containing protein